MSDSMLMKLSGLDLACHMSRSVVTNVTPDSPEAVGVAAAGGDGPHLVLALRQLPPPPLLLLLLVLERENRDQGVPASAIFYGDGIYKEGNYQLLLKRDNCGDL